MKRSQKDAVHAVTAGGVGAGVGAGAYALIGGIGITALGAGVGITLAPFMAIGAGLSLAGYGPVRLGKQIESKNVSSDTTSGQIVVNKLEE